MTDPVAAIERAINTEGRWWAVGDCLWVYDENHVAQLLLEGEDAIRTLLTLLAASERRREELIPLARLGLAALEACRDGDDYEGYDIQEAAEKFGVVEEIPAPKPCGENCRCEEYEADVCYRDTPATTAARAMLSPLTPGGPDA